MTISIDRNIYSDSCVSNVVYWLSASYTIQRGIEGSSEVLEIDGVENEDAFKRDLFLRLNDFKLREIVESDTKDIKTILYAKAFGEFDNLSEEDILE